MKAADHIKFLAPLGLRINQIQSGVIYANTVHLISIYVVSNLVKIHQHTQPSACSNKPLCRNRADSLESALKLGELAATSNYTNKRSVTLSAKKIR